VSEQRLRKYRLGDEIDMVMHIQHAPTHLRDRSYELRLAGVLRSSLRVP
jgi:hypothetical protein